MVLYAWCEWIGAPSVNKIHFRCLSALIFICLFNADCTTVCEHTATENREQNKLANNTLCYTLTLDTGIISQYVIESGHSSDESAQVSQEVWSWKLQKTEHSSKDSISKILTSCLGYIKIQTQLKGPILCNFEKKLVLLFLSLSLSQLSVIPSFHWLLCGL